MHSNTIRFKSLSHELSAEHTAIRTHYDEHGRLERMKLIVWNFFNQLTL